jgi:hypothetical protein
LYCYGLTGGLSRRHENDDDVVAAVMIVDDVVMGLDCVVEGRVG